MANTLQGKAFGLRFKDIYFECQTDLSFDNTANLETPDVCKPNPEDEWVEGMPELPVVSSTAWTASVTAKATDAVTGNQVDALKLKAGTKDELEIFTNVQSANSPILTEQIISGTAILTGISLGAPSNGEATYELSFTGYGDFTPTAVLATT